MLEVKNMDEYLHGKRSMRAISSALSMRLIKSTSWMHTYFSSITLVSTISHYLIVTTTINLDRFTEKNEQFFSLLCIGWPSSNPFVHSIST